VVWKLKEQAREKASELAQKIFDACATRDLHLALVQLPLLWFEPSQSAETGLVACLRSVLMKPEHEAWLGRIWDRLSSASKQVLGE
jgi:hypothetical protein